MTGGLDGEWLTGARQSVDVDLSADYNRLLLARHGLLDYVSSNDQVAWNWGLGDALSGKVGVDYLRVLGGFANTEVYSRDIVSRADYFDSLRYQVGPRWGLFGGVMGTDYSVSADQATFNNSRSKGAEVGADFSTETRRIGFDYRYNDSRAPNSAVLNGVVSRSGLPGGTRAGADALLALTEKTVFDGSAGYLKRDYPSTAIGSFAGEIWRASVQWQPTPKTQVLFGVWRQLDADLTSQTDYFVDKGVSIAPQWTASEKITFSARVSRDNENYVGANPIGNIAIGPVSQPGRRDTLTAETASMLYTPISAIQITASASHATRDSNIPQFHYNDLQANINVTYKFFRYGNQP